MLPKGRLFRSPSATGKAVTGSATNGYRFWSIPDKPPAGQPARQRAALDHELACSADSRRVITWLEQGQCLLAMRLDDSSEFWRIRDELGRARGPTEQPDSGTRGTEP